jgi:hypothetical protein
MASLALHNEMVSAVVRGLKILRGIEWAAELAEEQLLEARMVVATSLEEDYDPEWAPSPEEIAAACDTLYASWGEEEREQRRRLEYVPQRLKRYVADFNHLKESPNGGGPIHVDPSLGYKVALSVSHRAERCRHYRERNRERIIARKQDPEWQARRREQLRRYRERNQFLIKERKYANREEISAYQKKWRDEHAESVRAQKRAHYAENREELLSRKRESHSKRQASEREAINEQRRRYYAANREAILESKRQKRAPNRDELNAHRRAMAALKRAQRREADLATAAN